MKYCIDEIKINNFNKTKLYIRGWVLSENFKVEIFCGNDLLYSLKPNRLRPDVNYCFNNKYIEKKYGFEYSKIIPNSMKKISIYIKGDNTKLKIYKFYNNKISNVMRKIFGKSLYLTKVIVKGIKFLWREHKFLLTPMQIKKYFKMFILKLKYGNRFEDNCYNPYIEEEYRQWILENSKKEEYSDFKYNPLISIIVPVYNISSKYLSKCIDSVINQKYSNWELCLCDDKSANEDTLKCLEEYSKKDNRIKVVYRDQNGHISRASNSALEIATGEFVALLDNDDELTSDALYEVVKVLNHNKNIDLIYSDEDKLSPSGKRCHPNFKPDWSPDTFLSHNYICHLAVLRRSIVEKIGGFTPGVEGAQDYDLFLRFTEETNRIYHIPKVLYHWRMIPSSTSMNVSSKSYVTEKGKKVLEEALKRRKIKGEVLTHDSHTFYTVKYDVRNNTKVSIIIPTRDCATMLDNCLKSIYKKTTYKNYEIIVINNGSVEAETFKMFNKYSKKENFKVIDMNCDFNYSYLNNEAVKISKGSYIVLLNNDTEVITPNWIELMLGHASQPHVGAVGAKLLYPNNTIQHAGVILGIRDGIGVHASLNEPRFAPGIMFRGLVPSNYSAVTGACLMINKKKFLEVGGLEEKLAVAYNDVDLCLKLLSKKYFNVYLPDVELYHYESVTRGADISNKKFQRLMQETRYMIEHWESLIKSDPYYNPNYSRLALFMLDKKTNKNK